MMQRNIHRLVWLFALWMLSCIGAVNAASQVEAPAAWRTTPTLSADITPAYQFRSTSTYAPIVGATSYTSTTVYTPGATSTRPHRSKLWEDTEDENPVGQVDDPAPIGEPMILILFALAYILYKRKRATA